MTSIGYNTPCQKNKDCKSNVCEMIYENNKPRGRYCLSDTGTKYTKNCSNSKDCRSGECQKIFDKNGHFLTRKCIRAPKIDTDSAYNTLFGKERGNKYGVLNSNAIQFSIGDRGPISEIIILIFSIVADLFQILVFNFDACNDARREAEEKCGNGSKKVNTWGQCMKREDKCHIMSETDKQGMLYRVWRIIFDIIFGMDINQGFIWSAIQGSKYDDCTGKCTDSYGLDLWYVRTFITILFPPFGVLMAKGLNGFFYIILSCVLTTMFYFPGLIYSFAVINASELEIYEINNIEKIKKINKNKNKKK
jgi:uncharacterized membrane protein YqaE (UPF0057 family)